MDALRKQASKLRDQVAKQQQVPLLSFPLFFFFFSFSFFQIWMNVFIAESQNQTQLNRFPLVCNTILQGEFKFRGVVRSKKKRYIFLKFFYLVISWLFDIHVDVNAILINNWKKWYSVQLGHIDIQKFGDWICVLLILYKWLKLGHPSDRTKNLIWSLN